MILRQHFGMAFLKIDLNKKTIINIDETWIGMSDFRRWKWTYPGRPNSVPKKNVLPRISMVVGIDTGGSVILSLYQVNSNSQVMELFFGSFIKMMDEKKPGWRKDTVLMMDNAAYHTSSTMMKFYEDHQLPILFTGPHSYAASPVELFFAHFKKQDINPRKLPTGKK